MKKLLFSAALAAAALLGATAHASTIGVGGGNTDITVTADLAGLGLTPTLDGTATANADGSFRFPITGGSTDGTNAIIRHDGSGVTLTAGSTSASIGDFIIDTKFKNVTGTLFGAGSGIEFFTFGETVDPRGVELLISSTLAGALTDVFGAGDLSGAQFGFAAPDPQVVPLPAGAVLLLTGIGALALRGRRKAA
jgi:hypothetical protein